MSRAVSPSSNKPYGVARVVALWTLPRSSFYAARQRERQPREAQKRGPKVHSDADLVAAIRQLLEQAVFSGEGYRKVWARLRHKDIRTSKERILRLLRENQLLSPARQPQALPSHPHEGTIVAEAPDRMWGTDATATVTESSVLFGFHGFLYRDHRSGRTEITITCTEITNSVALNLTKH
jgi:hypothetical protein